MTNSTRRSYTEEQLAAEIAQLPRRGGRPRKYATEEERREAINASHRRGYQRKMCAEGYIVISEEIAPRKKQYETDEQRREARARVCARIYAERRKKPTLPQMTSYICCST